MENLGKESECDKKKKKEMEREREMRNQIERADEPKRNKRMKSLGILSGVDDGRVTLKLVINGNKW